MRATTHLVILAAGHSGGAAVDLSTGALIRAHWLERPAAALAAFDIVETRLVDDDGLPFPSDSARATCPSICGRLTGRRAERLLRPLEHPLSRPLLGGPTAVIPYWTLRSDEPSVAVLSPASGPVVERDWGMKLRCRFRWRRLDHDLPLDDPAVDERLAHPTATVHTLEGGTLARALGWRPRRLVVVLTSPREGMCQKVVAGLLPKP